MVELFRAAKERDQGSVSADELRRGDGPLRGRQTRHPLRTRARRGHRPRQGRWGRAAALRPGGRGQGGIVKAIRLPGGGGISRTELDGLEEVAKSFGARGLARAKVAPGGEWTQSPLAKGVTPALRTAINQRLGAGEGESCSSSSARPSWSTACLGSCGVQLAQEAQANPRGARRPALGSRLSALRVLRGAKPFVASHHPFTSPRPEDVEHILTDPGR